MMKPDLNITLIQAAINWEDADKNRVDFSNYISQIDRVTDLIILPETFTTGFSMKPELLAETMQGRTVQWMTGLAEKSKAVISGSIIIKEDEAYYNRLIWMQPDGKLEFYDKRHLFTMGGEDKVFATGKKRPVFDLKGWKIAPQICYDLRFPAWSRNDRDFDLLLYVANWPARRAHHWSALLRARAIENLAWVAALNRVGEDGHGVAHSGNSTLINPVGDVLWEHADDPVVKTLSLDGGLVESTRKKFAFLNDQDQIQFDV
ncbi:MAG: omega-amidase [Limisphaerales bacterium]|jgi:omega-amidase